MGLEGKWRRVQRLQDEAGPILCGEHPPCRRLTTSEVEYVHGAEVLLAGEPPAPLCAACPYHDDPAPPVRHITVVKPADA